MKHSFYFMMINYAFIFIYGTLVFPSNWLSSPQMWHVVVMCIKTLEYKFKLFMLMMCQIDKVNLIACMILMFWRHCYELKLQIYQLKLLLLCKVYVMEAFAYTWCYNLKHNCVFGLSLKQNYFHHSLWVSA